MQDTLRYRLSRLVTGEAWDARPALKHRVLKLMVGWGGPRVGVAAGGAGSARPWRTPTRVDCGLAAALRTPALPCRSPASPPHSTTPPHPPTHPLQFRFWVRENEALLAASRAPGAGGVRVLRTSSRCAELRRREDEGGRLAPACLSLPLLPPLPLLLPSQAAQPAARHRAKHPAGVRAPSPHSFGRKAAQVAQSRWGEAINELQRMQARSAGLGMHASAKLSCHWPRPCLRRQPAAALTCPLTAHGVLPLPPHPPLQGTRLLPLLKLSLGENLKLSMAAEAAAAAPTAASAAGALPAERRVSPGSDAGSSQSTGASSPSATASPTRQGLPQSPATPAQGAGGRLRQPPPPPAAAPTDGSQAQQAQQAKQPSFSLDDLLGLTLEEPQVSQACQRGRGPRCRAAPGSARPAAAPQLPALSPRLPPQLPSRLPPPCLHARRTPSPPHPPPRLPMRLRCVRRLPCSSPMPAAPDYEDSFSWSRA